MMNSLISSFIQFFLALQIPVFFTLFLFILFSFFWLPIFKFFKLIKYNNLQKVHEDETARLGGSLTYLFLILCFLFGLLDDFLIKSIIISSIPIVLVSFKEDLFHDTSPKIRLLSMILSCAIFFIFVDINFPSIEFPFLNNLFSEDYFNFIFYTFALIVLMNGMNLIDGLNGLFGFTALFQLLSLIFLSYSVNDFEMINVLFIPLIPLIIFLFFNFPSGKIFAGDFGAYLFGFINGILTIYFFGKHPYLMSWLAVLILFYPCYELLFSYIRKIRINISPLDADDQHLHTLFYRYLNDILKIKKSNSFATLLLAIFWLTPFLFTFILFNNVIIVILLIISLSVIYIMLYKYLKAKRGN